ncbi:MAG: endonuclease III [Eubacteriales bacterium]|nr:endonuclease III [Eubacteriales bacterium]
MSDIGDILKRLEAHYLGARPGLVFYSAFELLIATMLSAQTTDRQVNAVTATLFQKYPDARRFCALEQSALENMIKSCGFYRTKAANIKKTCCILEEKFGGQVPGTLDELQSLPGVGRKTANVVLSNAFGVAAIAVDTHVFRVSNRLGLAHAGNVEETEKQLMKNIPKDKWSDAHHWLIWHGRKLCSARNPKCGECFLADVCEHNKKG